MTTTIPYLKNYPPPETFIKNVVPKLRAFGLTKTEAFMLVNLGIGLPRKQNPQAAADTDASLANGELEEIKGEQADEEGQESDDRQLLSLVIEELEERFPGEQGEAKAEQILQTMKTEFDRARAHTKANSDTNGAEPM